MFFNTLSVLVQGVTHFVWESFLVEKSSVQIFFLTKKLVMKIPFARAFFYSFG